MGLQASIIIYELYLCMTDRLKAHPMEVENVHGGIEPSIFNKSFRLSKLKK